MFINLITGNGGGAGVTSLNDQKGDLKLKTVNSNDLLGEGNIEIQAGVTSVNGQTGEVFGELPVDYRKIAVLFAAVFFPVFLLLLLGGYWL